MTTRRRYLAQTSAALMRADENETTVLDRGQRTEDVSRMGKMNKDLTFRIEYEITFLHSEELVG